MTSSTDILTPHYLIHDTGRLGSASHIVYVDDWAYGRTSSVGSTSGGWAHVRRLIRAHVKDAPTERAGLPIYYQDDHGGIRRCGRAYAPRPRRTTEAR